MSVDGVWSPEGLEGLVAFGLPFSVMSLIVSLSVGYAPPGFLVDDEREEEGGNEDGEDEKPFAAKFAALKNVDKPSFKRKRNDEVDDYEEYERSVNGKTSRALMTGGDGDSSKFNLRCWWNP